MNCPSCCANDKRKPGKNLSASQKRRNRKQSSVRARVEHAIKRLWHQQFIPEDLSEGQEKSTSNSWALISEQTAFRLSNFLHLKTAARFRGWLE